MYAWRISSQRRVVDPVAVDSIWQTGFCKIARSFDVTSADDVAGPPESSHLPARSASGFSCPKNRSDGGGNECRRHRITGKSSTRQSGCACSPSVPHGHDSRGFNATAAEADSPTEGGVSTAIAIPASHSRDTVDDNYFERQDGAWCGMNAVKDDLSGPHVDKRMCRNSARMVIASPSQALGGDAEDMTAHLDPKTVFF